MKRKSTYILAALCACLAATQLRAQQIEAEFADRLRTVSAATETIECRFTLTRTMSFMAGDVISRGDFYYLRGVGISLDFTEPAGDEITMGRDRFRIVSGGKANVVKLDSNPMLGQLKRMLTACMTGDVEALKEGSTLSFAESDSNYTVTVVPDNRRAKNMITLIVLIFEKQNMSLTGLHMYEASGDVSEYMFYDKTFNKGVDAARFDVR